MRRDHIVFRMKCKHAIDNSEWKKSRKKLSERALPCRCETKIESLSIRVWSHKNPYGLQKTSVLAKRSDIRVTIDYSVRTCTSRS
jgi:hypothetical protein